MPYPLTIAAGAMRDINRSAILEIIRREGPISRTAIAERLEVSLPTVMRIVDELTTEELVRAHGESEWSGGRRRALLEFNADAHLVLGVDMGGTKMYGALATLGGTIIAEQALEHRGMQAEESFDRLCCLIDALLAAPEAQGRRVRGIGVGAPGVTLQPEGVVTWAYVLGWHNFPLKQRLSVRYPLPITVDNDVNLAALGELWFGAGQDCQNMVAVSIGTGIGAGIIIDRSLYRGSHQASGEIGNLVPGREFLAAGGGAELAITGAGYAEFGALETVASGTGIAARAAQARRASTAPSPSVEDVFEAARQGQKWAVRLVDDAVGYLAVAVANLSVLFDPDLIVLGGSLARFSDLLVEPILHKIRGATPSLPRLVVSPLGERAAIMGAITHVLHNTGNFYVVHKLT